MAGYYQVFNSMAEETIKELSKTSPKLALQHLILSRTCNSDNGWKGLIRGQCEVSVSDIVSTIGCNRGSAWRWLKLVMDEWGMERTELGHITFEHWQIPALGMQQQMQQQMQHPDAMQVVESQPSYKTLSHSDATANATQSATAKRREPALPECFQAPSEYQNNSTFNHNSCTSPDGSGVNEPKPRKKKTRSPLDSYPPELKEMLSGLWERWPRTRPNGSPLKMDKFRAIENCFQILRGDQRVTVALLQRCAEAHLQDKEGWSKEIANFFGPKESIYVPYLRLLLELETG